MRVWSEREVKYTDDIRNINLKASPDFSSACSDVQDFSVKYRFLLYNSVYSWWKHNQVHNI